MDDLDLKGKSILVVDDDLYSQVLLHEIFRSSEANVAYVSTANDAITYCENNPEPNFIMLDIQLPDMDGVELTKLIRNKVPASKIIAVTACVYGDILDRCYKAGMQGYISKPLVINELKDLMKNCN